MESNPCYLTHLQTLLERWSCWQYYGPASDVYLCGRALQSPIPSASGDASYVCFRRIEHVLCEIGVFRHNRYKNLQRGFSESGLNAN